jgi:phosphatidylglycerol---prolipoprotein diacylglyceryl transferase
MSMFAYYLHDLSPYVFKIGDWGPRWYGVAYVLSFLFAYWLYRWLARRGYTDMPEQKVADFITYAAIFGVMIGGRIGWILFYGFKESHDSRWWPFKVWEGGMSSHGGILGLVLFTWWFARRHKLSWTGIGDSLCVVACVGLFLVRCANFVNGELYGKPVGEPGGKASVPWAVIFPTELNPPPALELIQKDEEKRRELRESLPPRHPSQIYEALLEGVLLFSVLWFLRTRCRIPRGVITGAFFILYAALRIIGEVFRVPDPAWKAGRLSAGQTLSLGMFVIGACFIAWGIKTQQYEPALTREARTGNPEA